MSSAATALIWWIIPALALFGALGYVLWISKFQSRYRQETQRSVGQFQRFQESFRNSQARDINAANHRLEPDAGSDAGSDPELSK